MKTRYKIALLCSIPCLFALAAMACGLGWDKVATFFRLACLPTAYCLCHVAWTELNTSTQEDRVSAMLAISILGWYGLAATVCVYRFTTGAFFDGFYMLMLMVVTHPLLFYFRQVYGHLKKEAARFQL